MLDSHEDALNRLNESWTLDDEVHPLPPERLGTVGPYAMNPAAEPEPKKASTRVPKHIRGGLGLDDRRR